MGKKLRVGVLFGGRSGEHEVSLVSAASVLRGLDPQKYEVIPIGITKEGRWVLPASHPGALTHAVLRKSLRAATPVLLPPEPGSTSLVQSHSPAQPASSAESPSFHLDVVFPVLHGTFGEDGTVQGLLELADLPYVGAGVLGSAVSMDKEIQKRLCQQARLPVVPFQLVRRHEWEAQRESVLSALRRRVRPPVFVKPAALGSSVGITKVRKAGELPFAIDQAAEFGEKILVERAIRGREFEVSVLGNEEPQASLPGEVMPEREFYDYTAKYLEDSTRFRIPAQLPPPKIRRLQELAVAAFRICECEGMARVDLLLERSTGKILINEINTIPGFTSISMYPKLWKASGLPYPELLDRLIQLALARHRRKARTRFSIDLPTQRGGVLKE